MKRLLSLMLCLLLLAGAVLPAQAAQTQNDAAGGFYLTASISSKTLIEPVRVAYQPGQSVQQALLASSYTFDGLENGYLYAVQGQSGNYTYYYDGGGYDLSVPASSITALYISEVSSDYQEGTAELIAALAQFAAQEGGVRRYAPAQQAYETALKALRGGADNPAGLQKDLQDTIDAYNALLDGTKYTVTAQAVQAGSTLAQPEIRLTDAYGNETSGQGSVQVVAGAYRFCISDGGYNRTEGTVQVDGDQSISVTLPSGQWFSTILLQDASQQAFSGSQDDALHTASFLIPDTAGAYGLYLNASIGAVPDRETTRLRTIYTGIDGEDKSETVRSWNSSSTSLTQLLEPGLTARSLTLEAQYDDAQGYCQIQSYTLTIERQPTLRALEVYAGGTRLPLAFQSGEHEYTVNTVQDTLQISAAAFGETGYRIVGDGSLTLQAASTDHTVTVLGENGRQQDYTLHIEKKQAVRVTVSAPSGVQVQVFNAAETEIAPTDGAYLLIPGERYTAVATKDGNCHVKTAFTAEDGLQVSLPAPQTQPLLQDFALYSAGSSSAWQRYESEQPLAGSYALSYQIPDTASILYGQATCQSGYSMRLCYRRQSSNQSTNGKAQEIQLKTEVSDALRATALTNLVAQGGFGQSATLYVEKEDGGYTYYQNYEIALRRVLQLRTLSFESQDGAALQLLDEKGTPCSFDRKTTGYTLQLDRASTSLTLCGAFTNENASSPVGGGYYAELGGTRYDSLADVALSLDPQKDSELLSLTLGHEDASCVPQTYKILVKKTDPVRVTFQVTPAQATVYLLDTQTGKRVEAQQDGSYLLVPGMRYEYTISCAGYLAQHTAQYTAPSEETVLTAVLQAAPENPDLPSYDAAWPGLRADKTNNGVVSDALPTAQEEAMLSWSVKLGDGFSAGACGSPILVNGYLYTYASKTIYKLDCVSGEILATGRMDHASSFAITPPTYGGGMIFVGLANGTIQAFNAETLESVWIYHDPLGGQPNCPILYQNGYIYTGFWRGENLSANYVCLTAADEDPTKTQEEKLATWRYTALGGFYWAGAYVQENALVVGTDDGEDGYLTGHANLLSLNPVQGTVKSCVAMPFAGDLRSSVTYYEGNCYFTSKGGYFCRITLNDDGTLQAGSLRTLQLSNYADDAANPAMSTSTPTIYNGRAYVGVSGVSQFGAYSGHNITVIDLASWDIAYRVRTQGYPQTSALLTTAYEPDSGYVYVYFFDNFTPGKLRMLRDRPGQSAPELTVAETDPNGQSYDTAYVLFTPDGAQAQYAICSPIADSYGTLYFKNDSGYLMALSSTITKLEITEQPEKLQYQAGETFKSDGMRVTAYYQNGKTRDVTDYVTWSEDPLTAEDQDFRIIFPYAQYQDKDGAAGQEIEAPFALLSLQIEDAQQQLGDIDGDGEVTPLDAAMTYAIAMQEFSDATAQQQLAADVDGDGEVTPLDAAMVYAYAMQELSKFPAEG